MRTRLLTIATAALLTNACGGPQSMLAPGGPAAAEISWLSWFVLITFSVVAVIMWAIIAWIALRRRGSLSFHEPVDAGGGQSWILVGGFLVPFVILGVVFVLGLGAMSAFPLHERSQIIEPVIRITGHQWWWEVEYLDPNVNRLFKTANEIHIPAGQPVDIQLQSADVIHSFWVPRLHGKEDLIPGQPNAIRIQADQPGVYRGQCGEYCGAQHAHMRLVVVAELKPAYDLWMKSQLQTAAQPVNAQQSLGEQLFMTKACVLCHTIRGTEAEGTVGPDLTHLSSRSGIAANSFENNAANLSAWVTHAQSMKAACRMPNVTQFNGTELSALVAYLQSLQ